MKIIKCTCKHAFQDSLYGPSNRAMNDTKSGQYRCTVCNILHNSSSPAPIKIEKAIEKPVESPTKTSVKTTAKETPKKIIDQKKPDKKSNKKKTSLKGTKR
jgi:hypothetical protein